MLRLTLAASLVSSCWLASSPPWLFIAGVLVSAGLAAGFHTRKLAALCVAAEAARLLLASPDVLAMLPVTGSVAALVLIGPGAFSIDARLFGRRTVTLPSIPNTKV
jgi:hypothetical protein